MNSSTDSSFAQYVGMGAPSLADTTLPAAVIVRAHTELIENFVNQYLMDPGISMALFEAMAQEFFAPLGGNVHPDNIEALLNWLGPLNELIAPPMSAVTGVVSIDMIIAAGAVFDFFTRYARLIDPKLLPANVIPTSNMVDAVLELFHERKAHEATNRHNERS